MLTCVLVEAPDERLVKVKFEIVSSLLVKKQGDEVGHGPLRPKPIRMRPPDKSKTVGLRLLSDIVREMVEELGIEIAVAFLISYAIRFETIRKFWEMIRWVFDLIRP